jgi:hypothetical protein
MEALTHHVDILQEWASEQGVAFSDTKAMETIGIKLAQNLMKAKLPQFYEAGHKNGRW